MVDEALEKVIRTHLDGGALEQAASAAVRGYGPQILGWMRSSMPAGDADDAFGIFCESLWKQLGSFRGESSLLTWAYHLAMGASRRVIADPYRKRGGALATAEMEALAQEVRSTTAVHLRQSTADAMTKLRSQLDFEEQTLLILRVDRDLSWTDIATIMSEQGKPASEPALRKRFERLKAKIKQLAVDEGLLKG